MARGVNKVIAIGNLGQDPDIRFLPSGNAVANFSIAVSESWNDRATGQKQERTEWIKCVAFNKLAEIIQQYVHKGSKVYVEGKLQTRKWQAQDGTDRYSTEVVISDLQMLDGRSGGGADERAANQAESYQNPSYGQGQQQAQAPQQQQQQAPHQPYHNQQNNAYAQQSGGSMQRQPQQNQQSQDYDSEIPF